MSIYFTLPDGTRYVADQPRQLYQVLHWWEAGDDLASPRPEINRVDPFIQVLLTQECQWFWFGLMVHSAGSTMAIAEIMQAWRGLTQSTLAFTNGRGTDNCADFISGKNLDKNLPLFYPLVCGGNVLSGVEVNIKGLNMLDIDHMDGSPYSMIGVSRETHPWLIQFATLATTKQFADGSYQVNRFPQLGGLDVPVPIFASSKVYYPLARLRKLPIGVTVPSPYNQ